MNRNHAALNRVHLPPLMAATRGNPAIVIGMIDGPVDTSHPDLPAANFTTVMPATHGTQCEATHSIACQHGTYIAGILSAKRESAAPAICPDCRIVLRPIFCEATAARPTCPLVTPADLATAIQDTLAAGARIINLSVGLSSTAFTKEPALQAALDQAQRQGVVVVAAAGNQGAIGPVPLFQHPWVIPVVACDEFGRMVPNSNLGPSVGRRGLMAPGMGVTSTAAGGSTTQLTGSSMAVPFVTGTLALLWSLYPHLPAVAMRRVLLQPGIARTTINPPLLNAAASWRALPATYPTHFTQQEQTIMEAQATPEPETSVSPPAETLPSPPPPPTHVTPMSDEVKPAGCGGGCSAGIELGYIYALGTVTARFPNQSLEKEFQQAINREDLSDHATEHQLLYEVLSKSENQYIARDMCWVMTVDNVDAYLLQPRTKSELDLLVKSLNYEVKIPLVDVDLVIGQRGPLAPLSMCNGIQLPIVLLNQFYCFQVDDFCKEMLKQLDQNKGNDSKTPSKSTASDSKSKTDTQDPRSQQVKELLFHLMQLQENVGEMDGHRAVNYLAARSHRIYQIFIEQSDKGAGLDTVSVAITESSGGRIIADVLFRYVNRQTNVPTKFMTRVDVTGMFPFLVSPIQLYYGN